MAHPVERELLKITAYKSRTKFTDRQDYLSSILNAAMKLTDEDFDNLTDEAATWVNAAVEAKNSKKDELPDFDEVTATDEEDPEDEAPEDDEPEDEESDGDGDDTSDNADPDDDGDGDGEEGDPTDDNPEDEDEEPEDDDENSEPEPAPKKREKAAKSLKAAKEPKMKVPPKNPPKPAKSTARAAGKKSAEDDVVLDKWGCMEGSKNSRALAMFEKGATTKEVKETLGGTYYNIMKKMEQDGHSLEKEGAVIKLTHKDDKAKKAAPAPKAVAKKKK